MLRTPLITEDFSKRGRHCLEHGPKLPATKTVGVVLQLGSLQQELRRVRAVRDAHDAIYTSGEHRAADSAARIHDEELFILRVRAEQVSVNKVGGIAVKVCNPLKCVMNESTILHPSR